MTINSKTLRPGLLVSLKTSLKGNVSYNVVPIEQEHTGDAGEARAKWETERVITDPKEHEAGVKARSKIRSLIRSVCTESAFGFLCPEADREKLEKAIDEADKIKTDFNGVAALSRVDFNVLTGRIAADDEMAVKAISSEIRDLMDDMERGLQNCDVKAIREAASKAKAMGNMLSAEAAGRVQVAVDRAREAASKIAKAAETAAVEVDRAAIARISEMRASFLDLDDTTVVQAPATMPGRTIELFGDDDGVPPVSAAAAAASAVEM